MPVNMTEATLNALGSEAGGQGKFRSYDLDGSEGHIRVALGQSSEINETFAYVETTPVVGTIGQASETNTSIGFASADAGAEADWQYRITQPGVIWAHNFATEAEVTAFTWNSASGGDLTLNADYVRSIIEG